MRRHKVDREMGTNTNTCGWRRNPASGNRVAMLDCLSDDPSGDANRGWQRVVVTASVYLRMIEPRSGNGRLQTWPARSWRR
jgi:hypothetical protein